MLEKMTRKVFLNVLLAALVVAYVALLHSPLRLAGDSPVYLCDASDLADGRGFQDDHLPRGYPHALAALDLIHLGTSVGIVALNLLTLAAGLVCIATVLRREFEFSRTETNTICLLVCCSWMWIQLTTFPLSEPLFFAFSSMVLAHAVAGKESPALASRPLPGGCRTPCRRGVSCADDRSGVVSRSGACRSADSVRAAVSRTAGRCCCFPWDWCWPRGSDMRSAIESLPPGTSTRSPISSPRRSRYTWRRTSRIGGSAKSASWFRMPRPPLWCRRPRILPSKPRPPVC